MKIVKHIREWLDDEAQGKRTPEFLAGKCGLTGSAIRKILSGERKAEPATLIKIAPVLGVPAIRLLADAGYLTEADITAMTKESQIPPDLQEALKDPEMRRIIGKLWKIKIDDPPPFDIPAICDMLLGLPPDQMELVQNLLRTLTPKPSGT